MSFVLFLLNLPYTFLGIFSAVLSIPYQVRFHNNPIAIIISVKKFWWAFGNKKHSRAMNIGNIILLSPNILENDLEHELVHAKQWEQYPIIYPLLYYFESLAKGYRLNRFEDEAYRLSKSIYKDKK